MNIIEERINYLIENSEVKKVAKIFNEYFGEDLVDCYEYINASAKSDMISYNRIEDFLTRYCDSITNNNNRYEIVKGRCVKYIGEERYNDIKDKDLNHIPGDWEDLIDEIWLCANSSQYNEIIVRFPRVTVTNEHGKHIDIQELYAKISLLSNGRMLRRFELIRSYYPMDQWYSDYCHSHVSHISTDWLEPCTGTGPINSTMASLMQNSDENIWGLFCYELDKFVRVESLAGVPYRRLESVGNVSDYPVSRVYRNGNLYLAGISSDEIKDFLKELIEKDTINIAFIDNKYVLGDTYEKFWVKVSKVFAEWYNRKYKEKKIKHNLNYLLENDVIAKYIIKEGKVYSMRRRRSVDISDIGTELFEFKGETVTLNIGNATDSINNNVTYLLSMNFIASLIHKILIILNYNYGRQNNTTEEETNIKRRKIYV